MKRFCQRAGLLAGTMMLGVALPGAVLLCSPMMAAAQAPAATTPRALGTVTSVGDGTLSFTTKAGQAYTVTVSAKAAVKVVPPGSTDLKSAADGHISDIVAGDRVLVTGTPGDTGTELHAERILVMKAAAIAQSHEADEAAWAQGLGGIVKSVDAATGTITLSSGLKTITVTTTPATVVRHYAAGSVKFEDAVKSSISAVQPGDQLRVRGAKGANGTSITADEIVAGTFHNYSGTIASINATADTVSLKDLTTKKNVTVAVMPTSDVRRIPPAMAMGLAARLHGASRRGNGAAAGAPGGAAAARPPAGEEGEQRQAAGRAGADLSQMLSKLPTETLAGLKVGDAVMIVATSSADGKQTAITLLAGVDAILAAQPAGESMTLSPWSVGGSAPDMGGGGGPE
ncbi:MAG: hypothetical protein ABI142_00050 [Bryocella sp.]